MNLTEHTGCGPTFYSIGVIEFCGEQFDGFPVKVVFKTDGSEKALYLFSLWETDSKFRPWAKVHFCPTCGKSAEEIIQTELAKLHGQSIASPNSPTPVATPIPVEVMRTFFLRKSLDDALRRESRKTGESTTEILTKAIEFGLKEKPREPTTERT